jgi:hypothetical protein
MQVELIPLQLGDDIPVAEILANLSFQGIVTNPLNPALFSATMDAFQTQAVLTVPVLQGPPGNPGPTAQTMFFQNVNILEALQLPTDLGPTVADVGKFWLLPIFDDATGLMIATTIYVWNGTNYLQLPVGSPGSPGPYPNILPKIALTAVGNGQGPGDTDSWVAVDTLVHGTPANPVDTFNLAVPQGVQGPSSALGAFIDVDFQTTPPVAGDIVACSSRETPAAPTGLSVSSSTSGGTLAAGHYYWVVTATVPNGETLRSNEVNVVLTGSTSSATLSWTIPPNGGATGFNVYRGTAAGSETLLVGVIVSGTQASFIDTGAATVAATPPTTGITAGLPMWVPSVSQLVLPQFYTFPQSAFVSQLGIEFGSQTTVVGSFAMPPQAGPWVAWVFGKLQVSGSSISLTPLLVSASATINSGQQIAFGWSDGQSTITIAPNTGALTMTPTNTTGALVPAGVGAVINISVSAANGFIGIFDFNAAGSEIMVLVIPIIVTLPGFTQIVTPYGLPSGEQVGSMKTAQVINPVGTGSAEVFGRQLVSAPIETQKFRELTVPQRTSVRQHRPQMYHRRGMS